MGNYRASYTDHGINMALRSWNRIGLAFALPYYPGYLGGSSRRASVDVKSRVKLFVFFRLAYHIEIDLFCEIDLVGGY